MTMENIIKISELKVASEPDVLITRALGSCVAVCLYEKYKRIGGLCHFILPDSSISRDKHFNPGKFADTGISSMIKQILSHGGKTSVIEAKLIGGAKMFAALGDSLNIGEKNAIAAEKFLAEAGIPVVAKDTGDDFGRNVKMYLNTGKIEVSSFRKGIVEI